MNCLDKLSGVSRESMGWLGLEGRNALVSGGTKNIGQAIAMGLARAGANVAVIGGKGQEALDETLQLVSAEGGRYAGRLQDLGDAEAAVSTYESLAEDVGPFDIVMNVAAVRPAVSLGEITYEGWDYVNAVNLRAPFILARCALPGMMERGFGRIVNFSGMDAYWGRRDRAHVSTSKLGVTGLSRALASECADSGVTVNTIVPGTIDTHRHTPEWYPDPELRWQRRRERIPMGRLGRIEEVAAVALFIASTQSSYLTGHEFFVSGGSYPLTKE